MNERRGELHFGGMFLLGTGLRCDIGIEFGLRLSSERSLGNYKNSIKTIHDYN